MKIKWLEDVFGFKKGEVTQVNGIRDKTNTVDMDFHLNGTGYDILKTYYEVLETDDDTNIAQKS